MSEPSFVWQRPVLFSVEVQPCSLDATCFCSHLFFGSCCLLSFSLLWVSEAQLCFSALRWWTREGSNSKSVAWLGGLGSLGGSLIPSPSHRLLFSFFSLQGWGGWVSPSNSPPLHHELWTYLFFLLFYLLPSSGFIFCTSPSGWARWKRHASAWFKQPTHGMWVWVKS